MTQEGKLRRTTKTIHATTLKPLAISALQALTSAVMDRRIEVKCAERDTMPAYSKRIDAGVISTETLLD